MAKKVRGLGNRLRETDVKLHRAAAEKEDASDLREEKKMIRNEMIREVSGKISEGVLLKKMEKKKKRKESEMRETETKMSNLRDLIANNESDMRMMSRDWGTQSVTRRNLMQKLLSLG